MPLNAFGWTTEEYEKLAELVKPHSLLYSVQDPSRKNILAREATWNKIALEIKKPSEECKKRWRGLRDGYMRSKRLGGIHKSRVSVFKKLQFLDEAPIPETDIAILPDDGTSILSETNSIKVHNTDTHISEQQINSNQFIIQEHEMDTGNVEEVAAEEQVIITDNQEYYKIMLIDDIQHLPQGVKNEPPAPVTLAAPQGPEAGEGPAPPKPRYKGGRRKRVAPVSVGATPIKILPKPTMLFNAPKVIKVDTKSVDQRGAVDRMIEKFLKENTNDIDVFFRSMAASVKKLQPNLIPKVKMEVCNIIAKYEMQSYYKSP